MLVLKLALFFLNVVWIIVFQPLCLLLTKGPIAYYLPQIWHAACCKIFGIRVEAVGTPHCEGQVIFMANHVSYLDIPVLGAILRATFVAKQDVEGWALFGFLSKLQQTIFISRDRASAKTVQLQLDKRLKAGQDLILFPEGTSTDGRDVRPFKSSLFSLVVGSSAPQLYVQPVTLQVMEADGQLLARTSPQDEVDLYAWHVEMDEAIDVGAHLLNFARHKGACVRVIFHDPILARDYTDRKALALDCQARVKAGLV